VRAFDGHGERAETPEEVEPALRRALAAVRAGRQAVVNVLCGRGRE
jgi:thiamine pyrophosphate-dependent acetolactate synthase large subunit-like protein